MYVAKDQLPLEWQMSEARMEGVDVMFDIQSMHDGKMHARNVISTQTPNVGQAVSGTVKSYNPVKGFGFFSVEGLAEDVFFSKERIPADYAQQRLENVKAVFQLQQKKDGKFEAFNIQLAAVVNQFGLAVPQADGKRGFVTGLVPDAKRQRVVPAQVAGAALSDDTQYQGTIKSFRDSTGYGFIVCPQTSGDLRFHLRDLVDPTQGAPQHADVTFLARRQPDGRLQAHQVQLIGTSGQVCDPESMRQPAISPLASALEQTKALVDQLTSAELCEVSSYINQKITG